MSNSSKKKSIQKKQSHSTVTHQTRLNLICDVDGGYVDGGDVDGGYIRGKEGGSVYVGGV